MSLGCHPLLVVEFLEKEENVVAVGTVEYGENHRQPRLARQSASTGDVGNEPVDVAWL
jgi:hypothetical protein